MKVQLLLNAIRIKRSTSKAQTVGAIGKANASSRTGLSNKKWDKAIKGLTANKLARVEKTDAGLFVSLV